MNTKILLVIAGAVALSACGKNKKPDPDPSVSQWEFPLVEPAGTGQGNASGVRPVAPTIPSPTEFRVPNVTGNLPNLQNQPAPGPGGPLSVRPPTPPPTPTPGPEIVPAPKVTPGPELSPAPEITPAEPPSE